MLVGLAFFELIILLLIESVSMFVHPAVNLFLVSTLHIGSFLLDFLHVLATLKLFLLHLSGEILSLLPIFEHKSGLLFLSVSILSLDGLVEIANLLL